jgi:hypothetical protein
MNANEETSVAACDVCALLDGDERLKADVVWCQTCQAYLCQPCRFSPWRRFLAAWKRKLTRA